MISIDQVRVLEQKVKQAIQFIHNLRQENTLLKSKLADYEVRIQELESLLLSLKDNQTIIESGIQNAIGQLDLLDSGTSIDSTPAISADSSQTIETEEQPDEPAETQDEIIRIDESSSQPAPVLVETVEALIDEQYQDSSTDEPAESLESPQEVPQEDPVSTQQDFFLGDETPEKNEEEEEDPQQGLGIF